jgi:hypothetical protein
MAVLSPWRPATSRSVGCLGLGNEPNVCCQRVRPSSKCIHGRANTTIIRYGQLFTSSNDSKDLPGDDTIVKDGKPLLWFDSDQKTFVYKFTDIGDSNVNAYSTRTINTTYACESHKVDWSGFNEMLHSNIDDSITPEGLNDSIYITDQLQSNNTFYFVSFLFDSNGYNGSNDASTLNICSNGDPRCTIVQAFEYGADNSTDYWYYNCSITLGTTQGDVYNVSYINDETASYATNAVRKTFIQNAHLKGLTFTFPPSFTMSNQRIYLLLASQC